MKINLSANLSVYQKNNLGAAKAKSSKTEVKTDVASFSRGNTAVSDKRLISLKSSLQSDIYAPSSSSRLAELRSQIKEGTYRISTEALVDSILKG